MNEVAFDYDELISRLKEKADEVDHTVAQAQARAKAAEQRLEAMHKELEEAAFRTFWDGSNKDRLAALRREQAAAMLAIEDAALVEAEAKRIKARLSLAHREIMFARKSGREPIIKLRDWILEG